MGTPVRAAIVVAALGVVWAPGTFAARRPQQSAPGSQPQSIGPAPARRAGEGRGPFKTLLVRNAILIDGTGAPPVGPVDIVVSANRIEGVRSAGTPGISPRANRAPQNADHEIDATGMYVVERQKRERRTSTTSSSRER